MRSQGVSFICCLDPRGRSHVVVGEHSSDGEETQAKKSVWASAAKTDGSQPVLTRRMSCVFWGQRVPDLGLLLGTLLLSRQAALPALRGCHQPARRLACLGSTVPKGSDVAPAWLAQR